VITASFVSSIVSMAFIARASTFGVLGAVILGTLGVTGAVLLATGGDGDEMIRRVFPLVLASPLSP